MNNLKKNTHRIAFVILLFLYNAAFWKEDLGFNLLVLSTLITFLHFAFNPIYLKNKTIVLSSILSLFSGLMVVINHSKYSIVIHFIAFYVMIGLMLMPTVRIIGSALLSSFTNHFQNPFRFLKKHDLKNENSKGSKLRWLEIALIPFLVVVIFFIIYNLANPVFAKYSGQFLEKIGDWISDFFEQVSFARILFVFSGMIILTGAIYKSGNFSINQDSNYIELLNRTRKPVDRVFGPKMLSMGLKREYYSGLILLLALNIMIAILNIIDINFLWINFSIPKDYSLQDMVHNGTELLIVSIFLSILVIVFLFRNQLNFYPNNIWLKRLAYIWIAQNLVLCLSVALRNYHYIDYHGLAYKRIGVYVFLFFTVCGLISLYLKVNRKKTILYLIHTNSWIILIGLVLMCSINYDKWIAKNNLNHPNQSEIDIDFYLELSPKALPVIYNNLDKVDQQMKAHRNNSQIWVENLNFEAFKQQLDRSKSRFLNKQSRYSYWSWNLQDAKTKAYLKNMITKINIDNNRIDETEQAIMADD